MTAVDGSARTSPVASADSGGRGWTVDSTDRGAGVVIQREPSFREQVVRQLLLQLFSGHRLPGSTFSVPQLAEEFGVSATPVREAVLELVQRDLLEVMPAKGYRVIETSRAVIHETLEIRKLLEVPATRRAAEQATDKELATLLALAKETVRFAEVADFEGLALTDRNFHIAVLDLAGNDTLLEIVETLRGRSRLYVAQGVHDGLWGTDVAEEHVALVRAMSDQRFEDVGRIVSQHMSHALI